MHPPEDFLYSNNDYCNISLMKNLTRSLEKRQTQSSDPLIEVIAGNKWNDRRCRSRLTSRTYGISFEIREAKRSLVFDCAQRDDSRGFLASPISPRRPVNSRTNPYPHCPQVLGLQSFAFYQKASMYSMRQVDTGGLADRQNRAMN